MKWTALTIEKEEEKNQTESLQSLGGATAVDNREKSFFCTNSADLAADPNGTPNMQISSVGTRLTPGIGQASVLLGSNQDHSHFFLLNTNPKGGPSDSRMAHALFNVSTEATMPPSSMYHLL
jgi:hypothetical protein